MKINKKNILYRRVIFSSSVFILFLISCKSYSQVVKSNEEAINKLKSSQTKSYIEKNLIGYWIFKQLESSTGEVISNNKIALDNINVTEKIIRPNIIFRRNKAYEIIQENKIIEKGKWLYDDKIKILKLIYDKPKYNVPIDKLSNELYNKMKREGLLIEFKENNLEIHQIDNNRLSIVEHIPHNEFELKYNLRIYIKKN